MLAASLVTAVAVSFMGIIGFVGLIAPQIMRRVLGVDHRFLIPASALTGAALLLFSDTLARTMISPVVLPVGAITSFFGAPLFLFILAKRVCKAMILSVQGMKFHYPGPAGDWKRPAFSVEKGELLAILGTNGTGKTTLLKCINRILKPLAGARC